MYKVIYGEINAQGDKEWDELPGTYATANEARLAGDKIMAQRKKSGAYKYTIEKVGCACSETIIKLRHDLMATQRKLTNWKQLAFVLREIVESQQKTNADLTRLLRWGENDA